ncbi:hypothetical protein, partial [Pseudorhodobacter sp.]|uniref:hypothetical protein n=1 Tax=Pseudorhodobacter sp. TaxID=1934400 RepID=UPI002AFF8269
MVESDVIGTLPEDDRPICRTFAFYIAAAQLSPADQLEGLKGSEFGKQFLLSVIPYLKTQPSEAIIGALNAILIENDDQAAFRVLSSALYGDTQITPELEVLV